MEQAGVPTWLDQQHLDPAAPPERQINEALQTCAGLLLLVSGDSGDPAAGCGREWARALSYKRPILLLRLDETADIPYRLTGYPVIDCVGAARRGAGEAFTAAVARLREQLAGLTSPAGQQQQVQARLATAHADLRLARDAQHQKRIRADIEALKNELAIVSRIAADPAAAIERTRQSIAAGIERERQPAERPARLSRSKFINPPPLEVPGYFQDRFDETQRLSDFLKAPELRLLTVVGRGGIGKTALVARLLKHLERGELPDGIGRLAVDGSEGQPVILLLDNFETRLDPVDHGPTDPDLDEALHALLTLPPHRLKVIITSRVVPHGLFLAQPHCQTPLYLDEGLVSPFAEALLRARDPDGKLGLKPAADAELAPAVTHTRGYPRALEALTAALAADRDAGLADLLDAAGAALPDNVVEVLVGEAYSRLAPAAQQVLQALAVYGRPVPLTAVDYLLEPYLPAVDSAPLLKQLVNMNFVSKEGGHYYLHPVDRAHALSHIPEATPDNGKASSQFSPAPRSPAPLPNPEHPPYTRKPLTRRAADYFKTTRKPRAEWQTLADLAPQLAEFDLRCEAGDFDAAAEVLTDIDGEYLSLWGRYRLMIDHHQRLQGRIGDSTLQRISAGHLGLAYHSMGQLQQAIAQYQKALASAREEKNKQHEGAALGNLGNAYADLGETHWAIDYYEQALAISRDIGDRRGEGSDLGNLGNRYAALGKTRRAIEYYEQALKIYRDIGSRSTESIVLENLGYALVDLNRFEEALQSFRQAIQIADEIEFPLIQNFARWGLAQVHLYTNNLPAARTAVEAARRYDVPQNNHNVAALLGVVALRQGQVGPARGAFQEAISLADGLLAKTPEYFEALYAKGLAWCGVGVCEQVGRDGAAEILPPSIPSAGGEAKQSSPQRGELEGGEIPDTLETPITNARQAYRAALAINADVGVVARQRRLFEALAAADRAGVLSPLAGVWEETVDG